jgi:hypothetical protein
LQKQRFANKEPDAGEQFAVGSLHLGHHAPSPIPTCAPDKKTGIPNYRRIRGTVYRSGQQSLDIPQQRIISQQPDGILIIGPKITPQVPTLIACYYRFQHCSPILGAMHVAVAQPGLLHMFLAAKPVI